LKKKSNLHKSKQLSASLIVKGYWQCQGHCGHDRMVVGLLPIAISTYPTQAIQHYVIKFVSDLWQVGGFLRFPSPIKLTATI